MNKLVCNLEKNYELDFKYDKLKLVNISEVIYEAVKENFLKKLPNAQPKLNVVKDYLFVLGLRGGLFLLKNNIIPFVFHQNKKTVPHDCFLNGS
jgi:hypothetical protein